MDCEAAGADEVRKFPRRKSTRVPRKHPIKQEVEGVGKNPVLVLQRGHLKGRSVWRAVL